MSRLTKLSVLIKLTVLDIKFQHTKTNISKMLTIHARPLQTIIRQYEIKATAKTEV
jgi:hypothetical protein